MADKFTRNLRKRDRLCGELHGTFDRARRNGSTFADVLQERGRVYESPAYVKLPVYMQQYVRGYWTALYENLMRREVVFGGILTASGKFYSVDSIRADYYGKHGISPRDAGDDSITTRRGFYWSSFADKGEIRPWSV